MLGRATQPGRFRSDFAPPDALRTRRAAAMLDRLVHHAEVISLKGDSYRLKDRDLGRVPAAAATEES